MTFSELTENREATSAVAIAGIAVASTMVGSTWSGLCVLAVAIILGFACDAGWPPGKRAAAVRHAAFVAAALFILVVISVVPLPASLGHPIWLEADAVLGGVRASLAVDRGTPFNSLGLLLAPFALFIATLLLVRTDENLRLAWSALVGLSIVLTVPPLAWFALTAPADAGFYGVFGDPVSAALCLTILCFVSTSLAAYHRRRYQSAAALDYLNANAFSSRHHWRLTVFFAGAAAIFALGVLMTGARTGVVAFVGGVAVMLMMRVYLRASSWLMAIAPVVAGIVVLIGIVTTFLSSLDRLDMISAAATPRFCTYSATVAAVRDYFWVGSGLGTFDRVIPAYWLAACSEWNPADLVHSGFLEVPLTLGVGGLLVFLVGWFMLGRVFLHGLMERKRMQAVPLACVGILVALILDTALAFSMRHVGTSLLIAVTLASGCGISLARVK